MNTKKKLIVLYGNCQIGALYRILKDHYNDNFSYKMITNFKLIWNKEKIPEDFRKADILIYQPLTNHGIYDTDDIIKNMLTADCKRISVSYLFFIGYYPDYFKNTYDNLKTVTNKLPYGLFPYGHKQLSNLKDLPINEIIEKSKTISFIDKEFIIKQLNIGLNKIVEKDTNLDIKLSDFIMKNYKQIKMFHTVDHPTNHLMEVFINNVLKILYLPEISLKNYDELLGDISSPIYPCVYNELQLTFENNYFYCNKNKMSYDNWIDLYIQRLYRN